MKIAVFCGSSSGSKAIFTQHAQRLGKYIAEQGHALVYGGGKTGLMGIVADSTLAAGGEVYGVMPKALTDKEIQHQGLTQLFIVEDMHERKAKMAELADAFIALPGGIGTLEELFEIWTWGQLGYHHKACAIYNVDGYYDQLLAFVETMVENQFMREEYANMVQISDNPETLLALISQYQSPKEKWS